MINIKREDIPAEIERLEAEADEALAALRRHGITKDDLTSFEIRERIGSRHWRIKKLRELEKGQGRYA